MIHLSNSALEATGGARERDLLEWRVGRGWAGRGGAERGGAASKAKTLPSHLLRGLLRPVGSSAACDPERMDRASPPRSGPRGKLSFGPARSKEWA